MMGFYHPEELIDLHNATGTIDHLTYQIDYFQQISLDKESLKRLTKVKENIVPSPSVKKMMAEVQYAREDELLTMRPLFIIKIYEAATVSCVIHGMGMGHVRETGLTIHPVYGVPYIPSTSVKGLVRQWAIQSFLEGDESKLKLDAKLNDKEKAIQGVLFDLFGSEEAGGLGRFFDIYFHDFTIVPDVLTVHYPEYYGKDRTSPDDNQNPRPISFYTLASNEKVMIPFGILNSAIRKRYSDISLDDLLSLLTVWIEKAFKEYGIGSKTATGYGRLTGFNDITDERLVHVEKRRQEQKRVQEIKRQALLEAKKEQEKQRILESMTDEDRLLLMIKQLNPANKLDQDASKRPEIFDKVVALNNKEAAFALKQYWNQIGDWKKPSKKQVKKVAAIKEIIGE
jgi:CRISPR-associated protein Cmr6